MTTLERILYVEDEPDIREIARLALEMVGGFNVRLCASGDEALKAIAGFQPQLILLDVMMPGMDGPTTLQAIRQQPEYAQIPAIFMTAKVQPQEIEEYKALGALDAIAKPFDPMALAEQIRTLWQSAQ